MSKLTDEQITGIWIEYEGRELSWRRLLARAIESAATEPLLQRIAELERQLHEQAVSLEEASKDVKPCPTCESLARAVMLDQTGKA